MNDSHLKGRAVPVAGSVRGVGLANAQSLARTGGGIAVNGIASLLSQRQSGLLTTVPYQIGALATCFCHRNAHDITGTSISLSGGWTVR